MKIGQRVYINHKTHPFIGKITAILKGKDVFTKKKIVSYVVKADDDGIKYHIPYYNTSIIQPLIK